LQSLLQELFGIAKIYTRYSETDVSNKYFLRRVSSRPDLSCRRTLPWIEMNKSFADYQAATFRPGFDGLRGVGFLLVVTAHIPAVPLFSYLQGWTAVWVFFAISGYLVAMLLIREERETGTIAFRQFLIRRFFRIVPAYSAAILIYWAVLYSLPSLADEYQLFMARLPYYLTLMPEHAQTHVFTIFVHSWIIGIETKFYVLFPLAVFLLVKSGGWRFGATAVSAALLMAQGSFTAHAYCAILAGVMLAQLLEWPGAYAVVAMLTRVPAVVPMAFVVALFVTLRYIEVLPAVAAVATYLIAHVTLQEGVMRRVLTCRGLVYLGQRSYGAYLLHVLPIHLGYMVFGSATLAGGLMTTGFTLAVTIPAAELLHRIVERPGVEAAQRLTRPDVTKKSS
jgi:peptidoglycan/LPS O-acetylase OafA/YrhL